MIRGISSILIIQLVLVLTMVGIKIDLNDYNIIEYSASYYYDIYDVGEVLSNSDSVFSGKVLSIQEFVVTDEEHGELPYTLVSIKVDEVFKGMIQDKFITISYLGGVKDGELVVFEQRETLEETMPMPGQSYIFFSNKIIDVEDSALSFFDGTYLVESSRMMYLENDFYDLGIDVFISDTLMCEDEFISCNIVFEGPGGGSGGDNDGPGESFETAINFNYTVDNDYYTTGEPLYFKLWIPYSATTRITSRDNQVNVDVGLYSIVTQTMISSDSDSGIGSNFSLNAYNKSGYYYLIVTSKYGMSGLFTLDVTYDEDCYCVNYPSDLVRDDDYVNSSNQVIYDLNTPLLESEVLNGISLWENVGFVDFVEHNSTNTRTIMILEYYLNSAVAGFVNSEGEMKLNTWKLVYENGGNLVEGQPLYTIVHELGHVLGIAHMNYTNNDNILISEPYINYMRQGATVLNGLGPCDKIMIEYLYD